ncbi:MAG: RNA-binding protein [Bacteroidales bacterium]|nr:RNA-binding protein [Bacteroidales bacterium]
MNIFVAKLNFRTSSDVLRETFEEYGEVSSAKVIMDHATGRSKGFGFVEMPNDQEAGKAIDELNNFELEGSKIVVKKANPRNDNGSDRRSFRPRD